VTSSRGQESVWLAFLNMAALIALLIVLAPLGFSYALLTSRRFWFMAWAFAVGFGLRWLLYR